MCTSGLRLLLPAVAVALIVLFVGQWLQDRNAPPPASEVDIGNNYLYADDVALHEIKYRDKCNCVEFATDRDMRRALSNTELTEALFDVLRVHPAVSFVRQCQIEMGLPISMIMWATQRSSRAGQKKWFGLWGDETTRAVRAVEIMFNTVIKGGSATRDHEMQVTDNNLCFSWCTTSFIKREMYTLIHYTTPMPAVGGGYVFEKVCFLFFLKLCC